MADVISTIGEGFKQSFLMAYEVWWALVLGFAISAIVQAWVPRERIQSALAGSGIGPLARATGLGRRLFVLLLRRDRDRQVPLPEGRLGGHLAGLPVRLHQPRLGARAGDLDPARLAVRAGRVPRRLRDDRADGADAAALRLAEARAAGARARARRRRPDHQHHAAGERMGWRERLTSASGLVGRRPQLPRRLEDALEGDHDRLPARRLHRRCSATTSSTPLHRRRAASGADASRT